MASTPNRVVLGAVLVLAILVGTLVEEAETTLAIEETLAKMEIRE